MIFAAVSAGLVLGFAAAWVNYRITCACMAKGSNTALMSVNFLHLLVDAAVMGGGVLAREALPFRYDVTLVVLAVALSIATIIFSFRTVRSGKQP